jgi:Xaa-Pro dipeptidase
VTSHLSVPLSVQRSEEQPHIHFTREEFAQRQKRVRARLDELGYDGLLVFKVEDMYWLSGYDCDAAGLFHLMFIGANDELTHLARHGDLANILYSSVCDDIRIWEDIEGNPKSQAIKDMLASHGMEGKRIGVQVDTAGLLPRLYVELNRALDGWCTLDDAPDFIRELRLVKSPQELDYLRSAGEILDSAAQAAIDATHRGADEGDLFAEVYATILRRGGDMPAARPPLGNGDAAMNKRYTTGRKAVHENDQVTFELACGYRHYHTADMFVVLTGPNVDDRHRRMHAACVEALDNVQEKLRSGTTVAEVFETHRVAFARHGYEHASLPACGYTMGATWPPSWVEQPQIFAGNSAVLEPGMTLFTHMILNDYTTGLTMSLGEQAIITEAEAEIITHVPRDLLVVD